jgi:phosphonate transport system substrate-binding protein
LPRPLRFATFLAPSVRPVYEGVVAAVAKRLGIDAELTVGSSFAQFARGEVDAGFICGLPYVELTRGEPSPVTPIAAPVLAGERYAGRPIYFSDVIVRHDSDIAAFADLRGRSWAYNDRGSHSGYNLTRYHLVRLGETSGFFGRVVEAGFHQRAIRMVAGGEVDAAAIDSQVLAVELTHHPELAEDVRIVATLGPSTIQPLVASRHLPDEVRAAVRETVLSMHADAEGRAALATGHVERFVPVTDGDYDDIRSMLRAVEDAGFLTLR